MLHLLMGRPRCERSLLARAGRLTAARAALFPSGCCTRPPTSLARGRVIAERLAVIVLGAGSIAQPVHLGLTAFLILRGMQKRWD
jgi:hypothetical protein